MRIVLLIVAAVLAVVLLIVESDNLVLGVLVPIAVWGLVGVITGKVIIKSENRHLNILESIAAGVAWGNGPGLVLRLMGAPSEETSQFIFYIILGALLAWLGTGVNNMIAEPRT
jgi:hypothetical protein